MARAPQGALRLRLLSAAVGLPVLLVVLGVGGIVMAAVAALAAYIALTELFALLRSAGWRPLGPEGAVWGAVATGVGILDETALVSALVGGAAATLVVAIVTRRSVSFSGDWVFTMVGVLYVAGPLATLVLLRDGEAGLQWVLIAFLATFATDTGAYAVGRLIGSHRMAPGISPGKTWEGAAGGLAAAIGATVGLAALLDQVPYALGAALALGAAIGIVSQLGDLAESKLKRLAGAKDSGTLIPGHGGLLDRMDSLVLVFPLVYYASRVWPS